MSYMNLSDAQRQYLHAKGILDEWIGPNPVDTMLLYGLLRYYLAPEDIDRFEALGAGNVNPS